MTGAELKTLRESLGLSQQWLADNVTNARLGGKGVALRSVQYWEADRSPVPADVAEMILGVRLNQLSWIKQASAAAVQIFKKASKKHGAPAEIAIYRYQYDDELWAAHPELSGLPVTHHAAALARIKEEIEKQIDIDVVIEYKQ